MNSVHMISKLVTFINIQDYVINLDYLGKITVEYIVDKKVRVTFKDWVAIFPADCDLWKTVSLNLDFLITYEFVLRRPDNKDENRYKMVLNLKGAKNLYYGHEYRFVYVNDCSEVLGCSSVFRFLETVPREVLPKLNIVQVNNNKGEEVIENEQLKGNKKGRNHRIRQEWSTVQSSGFLQKKLKEESDDQDLVSQQGRHFLKNKKNKQGFLNKVHQVSVYSDSNLTPSCKLPSSSCSNCHRVGMLLKTQNELYTQVKNLAEMNSDLQKQVLQLQRQVELGQAAYQKLSVTLMHEREVRLFYQAVACDSFDYQYQVFCFYQQIFAGLDHLQRPLYATYPVFQLAPQFTKHQVMVVEPMPQSVFTPRDLPTGERQQAEEKARLGSMLKFKAIIGNQEEKIRSLTQKIAELQAGRVQKVKAIVRNIEDLDRGDQITTTHDDKLADN